MFIRVYYIREIVKENKIYLKYIKSENNLADGFTKYLNGTLMVKFRNSLSTKIDDLYFIWNYINKKYEILGKSYFRRNVRI